MLPTLTLAAAMLAAPVPSDARPAGPAPLILELTPDTDGKVRLTVVRQEKRTLNAAGGADPVQREITTSRSMRIELAELKDLAGYTVDGKEIEKADLLKKLGGGGTVVASTDGQKVDPRFLKLFRDDVTVLVSPELTARTAGTRTINVVPGGGIQVQPLPAQILPGRVQIQVAPAVEPVPAVEEKKPEKK